MTEVERLREQAARYRRMMTDVGDKRAHEALELLAGQCDAKVAKMGQEAPQIRTSEEKTGDGSDLGELAI